MAGILINAVENRMVIGEYYEDDMEEITPEHFTQYVYDNDLEREVLGAWLGVILTGGAAADLWEHLDPDFVEHLCQKWVEKSKLDDFVEYKKEKYCGAV